MAAEAATDGNSGEKLNARLDNSQFHLRWTTVEEAGDQALDDRCLEILSPDERERYQRFRYHRDRRLYLAAHTLLRATLSEFGQRPPQTWAFEFNEHGKPFLHPEFGDPPLYFNLTHAAGLAACVVVSGLQAGVDTESLDRKTDPGLSVRFFAPAEQAQLEGLSGKERQLAFFDIWTLKEAYVKGRGIGVSLPLRSFGFTLPAEDSGTIVFSPPADDRADNWSFFRFRPGPRHTLAVAIHHPSGLEPRAGTSRAVSLSDLL